MAFPQVAPVGAAVASASTVAPTAFDGVSPAVLAAVEPAAGTAVQFAGTLLGGWLLFAFTAHVAATYVLGDVPWRRAAIVGVVPAVVTVVLVRWSPLVIVPVTLAADFAAFHVVYRVKYRTAALVTVVHYVVSLAIVLLVANVLALLSTAPG